MKKHNPTNDQSVKLGYLPPQDIELEEVVLGAMMLEKDACLRIIDMLKPDHFYKSNHKKIYSAIIDLFEKKQAIDMLTVTEQLKKNSELESIGGPAAVSTLTTRINSSANIETHARILIEKHIKRKIIEEGSIMQKKGYDHSYDAFDALSESQEAISKIGIQSEGNGPEEFQLLLSKYLDDLRINKIDDDVVFSGFKSIDKHLGGFGKGHFNVIAARPGMAKTAMAIGIAINAVKAKKRVALFSLEMPKKDLVRRSVSITVDIEHEKLRKRQINEYDWERILKSQIGIDQDYFFIDDRSTMYIYELEAECKRLAHFVGLDMIIIDYLQLLKSKTGGNREQEVSQISRSLKNLAKDLNVPVIALSQLSRAVEARENKEPRLSDLRDSGSIEQDADTVCFLYRPEYYGIESLEGFSSQGLGKLIIGKHRHAAVSDIWMRFNGPLMRWEDATEELYFDSNMHAGF